LIGICLALGLAGTVAAGPPYVTDDAEPTAPGKWEIYVFGAGSHVTGETDGAGGLDFNYGGAKDLQLTWVVPFEYARAGGSTTTQFGDVELAAKMKFLHQDGFGADVAFFPRVFLPTAPRHGAPKQAALLLPLWVGREAGDWSVFGGGGYVINPGDGNQDFWQGGIAATRQVGERWNLGGEVYGQSADAAGGKSFAGVNLGLVYKLTEHWSLLASGGPGVHNAEEGGLYDFYLSLKFDS
jgi:hypothetical protein